jgi:hypothetical protein
MFPEIHEPMNVALIGRAAHPEVLGCQVFRVIDA